MTFGFIVSEIFSPMIINTTSEGVHFLNQTKLKVPISDTIDQKTDNEHDLCHQFSVYGRELLFGNLLIRDKRYKAHLLQKGKYY